MTLIKRVFFVQNFVFCRDFFLPFSASYCLRAFLGILIVQIEKSCAYCAFHLLTHHNSKARHKRAAGEPSPLPKMVLDVKSIYIMIKGIDQLSAQRSEVPFISDSQNTMADFRPMISGPHFAHNSRISIN